MDPAVTGALLSSAPARLAGATQAYINPPTAELVSKARRRWASREVARRGCSGQRRGAPNQRSSRARLGPPERPLRPARWTTACTSQEWLRASSHPSSPATSCQDVVPDAMLRVQKPCTALVPGGQRDPAGCGASCSSHLHHPYWSASCVHALSVFSVLFRLVCPTRSTPRRAVARTWAVGIDAGARQVPTAAALTYAAATLVSQAQPAPPRPDGGQDLAVGRGDGRQARSRVQAVELVKGSLPHASRRLSWNGGESSGAPTRRPAIKATSTIIKDDSSAMGRDRAAWNLRQVRVPLRDCPRHLHGQVRCPARHRAARS